MIELEMITLPILAVAGAMLLFLTYSVRNQKGKKLIALGVVPVGSQTPTAYLQLMVFLMADEMTNRSVPQHFLVIEDDSVRQLDSGQLQRYEIQRSHQHPLLASIPLIDSRKRS